MTLDPIEFGKVVEKLDAVVDKVEKLDGKVDSLTTAMHKGWGILIGAAAIVGLFFQELVDGVKGLLGMH